MADNKYIGTQTENNLKLTVERELNSIKIMTFALDKAKDIHKDNIDMIESAVENKNKRLKWLREELGDTEFTEPQYNNYYITFAGWYEIAADLAKNDGFPELAEKFKIAAKEEEFNSCGSLLESLINHILGDGK